jgi:hypothetical protein
MSHPFVTRSTADTLAKVTGITPESALFTLRSLDMVTAREGGLEFVDTMKFIDVAGVLPSGRSAAGITLMMMRDGHFTP